MYGKGGRGRGYKKRASMEFGEGPAGAMGLLFLSLDFFIFAFFEDACTDVTFIARAVLLKELDE